MNILAVGAHFDDVELGCSGTLMNHVRKGDNVTLLVLTSSGYMDPNGNMVRSDDIALAEGRAAAAIMGAELLTLDYRTFYLPFNEEVTMSLNKLIKDREIDTVYCHWIHDLHRDHQCAAQNTIMASRHVPRVLMYRSNHYDTPHTFAGNIYSDISGVMDRKIEVIKSHKSELERVRYQWVDFFTRLNSNDGQKIGVDYAECFEIVRYLI
ncbi:MAG: PIG-L family deacetylase [Desulfovibrio sp.]|jgi:LmbE family N-acetylglucosaminyl deacetylase|nr:PIG-L family deacetylase [Desulfovibrio sp.]